jgi:imidazoleglycerol phosphate dehydratase HisB
MIPVDVDLTRMAVIAVDTRNAFASKRLDSLEKLQGVDLDCIATGHGTVESTHFIVDVAGALTAVIEAVKDDIDEGATLKEAKGKTLPTAGRTYEVTYGFL